MTKSREALYLLMKKSYNNIAFAATKRTKVRIDKMIVDAFVQDARKMVNAGQKP